MSDPVISSANADVIASNAPAAAPNAAAPPLASVAGNDGQQQQPAHAQQAQQAQGAVSSSNLNEALVAAVQSQMITNQTLKELTMVTQIGQQEAAANTKMLLETLAADKAASAKKETQDSCAKDARALRKQSNREKALMLVGVSSIDNPTDRTHFTKACLEVISALENDVTDIEEPNAVLQQATKALTSLSKDAQEDLYTKTKLKKRTATSAIEDGCIRCGRPNHTWQSCSATSTRDGSTPTMALHASQQTKFPRGGGGGGGGGHGGSARGGGPVANPGYGYNAPMAPYGGFPPGHPQFYPPPFANGFPPNQYGIAMHPQGPPLMRECWNCHETGHLQKFCPKPPQSNGGRGPPQPPVPVSNIDQHAQPASLRVTLPNRMEHEERTNVMVDEEPVSESQKSSAVVVNACDIYRPVVVAREWVDDKSVEPVSIRSFQSIGRESLNFHPSPSSKPCNITPVTPVMATGIATDSSLIATPDGIEVLKFQSAVKSSVVESIPSRPPATQAEASDTATVFSNRVEDSLASRYIMAATANIVPDDVESQGQLASMYASPNTSNQLNTPSHSVFVNDQDHRSSGPVLTAKLSSEEEMLAELEWTGMPEHDLSLRRTIANFFQGKKKFLSEQQIAAQTCLLCEKKGHTEEGCPDQIQKPCKDRTAADKWVRKLIQMPRVDIEKLNRGLTKEEGIKRWLERGRKLNEGNPWKDSAKREDSLRKQLGYHKAMGMSSVHIGWLGFGIPLNFIREKAPEVLAFRNNKTAEEEADFVDQEHATCLADGTFVEVQRNQLKGICPLQVEKHPVTGKRRLCQNLKWINGHLPNVEFKMESLHTELGDVVKPGDKVFTTDLEKAYYCVALHPDAQPYLGWMWKGKYYMPTCLVFGLSTAPRIFTKIMRPMMAFMRSLCVRVLGMIDDYMWASRPDEAASLVTAVKAVLPQLGFTFNAKCIWEPADEVLMLGMLINTKEFIVRAPVKKVEAAVDNINRVLIPIRNGTAKRPPSLKLLQQITGRLMSMMLAFAGVRVFTRELYRCIAVTLEAMMINPRYPPFVTLTAPAVEELEHWARRLLTHNGLTISCRENQVEVLLWSDASDLGWGGARESDATDDLWTMICERCTRVLYDEGERTNELTKE